jgi:hypothetical protein
MPLNKIKNIPHKLRRELYRIPQINALKEQAYQKAVDYHAQFLPLLDNQGKFLVDTLRQQGTCIIPVAELNLSATEQMLATALSVANKLKISPQSDQLENCEISPEKQDFQEFPEFLLWALETKLLDIIENYIELPILYIVNWVIDKEIA